jgi:hypothetical protein
MSAYGVLMLGYQIRLLRLEMPGYGVVLKRLVEVAMSYAATLGLGRHGLSFMLSVVEISQISHPPER